MGKPCKKKKSEDPFFHTNSSMPFVCTQDKLTATIIGKPQSFKRTGGGNTRNRYDQQKDRKQEFVGALFSLYEKHGVAPKSFGRDNIDVTGTFVFARKNGIILNDVDNLAKFLLDCFQIPHNKIATCNNDNQVVRLLVEKKYGETALTTFTIVRSVNIADNDISDNGISIGIGNNGNDDNININIDSSSSSSGSGTGNSGKNNDSAIDLTGSSGKSRARPSFKVEI